MTIEAYLRQLKDNYDEKNETEDGDVPLEPMLVGMNFSSRTTAKMRR